ncbi:MAG: type I restriction enzyme HsdR N-terminal domain-containing protein [Cyclobacteriaceae bacterium]
MHKLNLPTFDVRLKEEEGNRYIFDIVRKKYLILTPEEWVRQHFIHLLINHLKYPRALIKMEFPMTYFKSGKRSDIIVLKRDMNPFLLVECKAFDIKLKDDVLKQASIYNKILKADYLAVTNGINHFVWQFKNESYNQLPDFPSYSNS